MNLPIHVQHQISLMKRAIKITEDMNTIDRLIGPVDPTTVKVMNDDLAKQYAEIMTELLSNMTSITVKHFQDETTA